MAYNSRTCPCGAHRGRPGEAPPASRSRMPLQDRRCRSQRRTPWRLPSDPWDPIPARAYHRRSQRKSLRRSRRRCRQPAQDQRPRQRPAPWAAPPGGRQPAREISHQASSAVGLVARKKEERLFEKRQKRTNLAIAFSAKPAVYVQSLKEDELPLNRRHHT